MHKHNNNNSTMVSPRVLCHPSLPGGAIKPFGATPLSLKYTLPDPPIPIYHRCVTPPCPTPGRTVAKKSIVKKITRILRGSCILFDLRALVHMRYKSGRKKFRFFGRHFSGVNRAIRAYFAVFHGQERSQNHPGRTCKNGISPIS